MSNNTCVKTILLLAANPRKTSALRLDEEVREIDEGLRRANKREQFKLEQKWAVRCSRGAAQRAIARFLPSNLGHSTPDCTLVRTRCWGRWHCVGR
ncbi:hypothetical protein [Mastigocladopsis repens]|uniref:hypothetical protein n=1 Tax=Mastigocladopsis repens TaxID=221287 RepID=UPI001E5ABE6E|nr:hypothetical protein [Mastigocladopsis repens]